jgi:hypothetical protein
MRSWIIAALATLALGMMAPSDATAAPATGQTTLDRTVAANSAVQDVRYVTRCHPAQVWRNTYRGRRLVTVRRCHRVWRR